MTVSVVIPTLNEEAALPIVLEALKGDDSICEIIVVDGGSQDKTCEIAHQFGTRLIQSACGRGQQLTNGINAASGEVIWMLHADTIPQPGAASALSGALQQSQDAPGGKSPCPVGLTGPDGKRRFAWSRRLPLRRARGFVCRPSGLAGPPNSFRPS